MKGQTVPDPTSAGGAGAILGWKALSASAAGGAGLAAVIVMLMTQPRSAREWAVGLITTVIGSIAGGAAMIMKFGLQEWFYSYTGLVAALGLAFACGLPAWALVRSVFTLIAKYEGKDLTDVIRAIKDALRS